MTKTCSKSDCLEINPQPLNNFYDRGEKRRGGKESMCKTCIKNRTKKWATDNIEYVKTVNKKRREKIANKEKAKIYQKNYRDKNREILNQNNRKYYYKNKEIYSQKNKVYREREKEALKQRRKAYEKREKKKIREYRNRYWRERCNNDPLTKVKLRIRGRLSKIFKAKKINKTHKTMECLGCSFLDFMEYVRLNWHPGMSWANYGDGKDQWSLDHTIPLNSAKNVEELNKLSYYSNIKPMWSLYNSAKRDMGIIEWENYKIKNNIDETIPPKLDHPKPEFVLT